MEALAIGVANGTAAGCAPTTPNGPIGIILGTVLVIGTAVTYIPQTASIVAKRSSAGVSPMTCAMLSWYTTSNLASSIVVKWRQIMSCRHGLRCLEHLLDALQQVAGCIGWLTVISAVSMFPPHNGAKYRALWALTVVAAVAFLGTAISTSVAAPCQRLALTIGQAFGYFASSAAWVCFVPQLIETWRNGPGELSFFLYVLQGVGAVLVNINQIVISHDPWEVWVPMTVSGLMMFAVLGIATVQRFGGYPNGFGRRRGELLIESYGDGLLNATTTAAADTSNSQSVRGTAPSSDGEPPGVSD